MSGQKNAKSVKKCQNLKNYLKLFFLFTFKAKILLVIVMEKMSNKAKGQAFEERAKMILEQRLGVVLESEIKLNDHKFDLVSSNRSIIIECKSLEWTASGNIPSAKLDNLDKAVNFLAKESAPPPKDFVHESFDMFSKERISRRILCPHFEIFAAHKYVCL